MKTAYLDCFSGISGDMFVGALIDAGLPFNKLKQKLKTLPLEGYKIEARKESRNGIYGTDFAVSFSKNQETARTLKDIKKIIRKGNLEESVKSRSIEIFETLAGVEGSIHGLPPDEIHFHEVGAVDSILDIVGAVFGMEYLGIGSLFVSPLPLGSGYIETDHGTIPIPSPATIALLKGVPVFNSGLPFEMVTPTGAALLKKLAVSFGTMPPMVIERVGYGTGSRDLPGRPNLVRILIGKEPNQQDTDIIALLETNLDDSNPEWLGHLMGRLFEAGALDVTFVPVYMKKNRPGIQVQVLTRPESKDKMSDLLLRESTALGVRFSFYQRAVLKRALVEIESPWGKIKVKKVINNDGSPYFLPEYEACRDISIQHGIPLKNIYYWIMALNKIK